MSSNNDSTYIAPSSIDAVWSYATYLRGTETDENVAWRECWYAARNLAYSAEQMTSLSVAERSAHRLTMQRQTFTFLQKYAELDEDNLIPGLARFGSQAQCRIMRSRHIDEVAPIAQTVCQTLHPACRPTSDQIDHLAIDEGNFSLLGLARSRGHADLEPL